MIAGAIIRTVSVCAISIFIASAHVYCAFVDITAIESISHVSMIARAIV
jgi:hypothetical protein